MTEKDKFKKFVGLPEEGEALLKEWKRALGAEGSEKKPKKGLQPPESEENRDAQPD